jgi:hypothetical protein
VKGPTIHGLRGAGVLAPWEDGYDTDQISNNIGMSRQMVDHYMRFNDQMGIAADGRKRLKLISKRDRRGAAVALYKAPRQGQFVKFLAQICKTSKKSAVYQ